MAELPASTPCSSLRRSTTPTSKQTYPRRIPKVSPRASHETYPQTTCNIEAHLWPQLWWIALEAISPRPLIAGRDVRIPRSAQCLPDLAAYRDGMVRTAGLDSAVLIREFSEDSRLLREFYGRHPSHQNRQKPPDPHWLLEAMAAVVHCRICLLFDQARPLAGPAVRVLAALWAALPSATMDAPSALPRRCVGDCRQAITSAHIALMSTRRTTGDIVRSNCAAVGVVAAETRGQYPDKRRTQWADDGERR